MITLQLPSEHRVLAFIKDAREGEIAGHVLVGFTEETRMHRWATYMVRKDGMCFHGDYVRSESDGRYSLLRRAGWATVITGRVTQL
jgi:hypothetical protein